MGLWRAGFDVTGVDFFPQPNYPFPFIQADAVEYLFEHGDEYDAHWSGPPCQASGALGKGTNAANGWGAEHFDLIDDVRTVLTDSGRPFVIENVAGAKLRKDIRLCGETFRLGVIRHRYFEVHGFDLHAAPHYKHRGRVRGMRHGVDYEGPYVAVHGSGGGKANAAEARAAMGIEWMPLLSELVESIPPAYSQYLGAQMIGQLR